MPEISIQLGCIVPKVLLQLHDFKTSSLLVTPFMNCSLAIVVMLC